MDEMPPPLPEYPIGQTPTVPKRATWEAGQPPAVVKVGGGWGVDPGCNSRTPDPDFPLPD